MASSTEIVDAEIVETHAELERYQPAPPPATLFGTDDPDAFVEKAANTARALANVVRTQRLMTRIQQSEHVRVEGWTLLGSMLGVYATTEWTRQLERDGAPFGWEARVVAHDRSGVLVGAAEAQCTRDERTWKTRDDYALRSMAQTRATSKALRQPLGFVMQLAGFNPTPAEEMPSGARRSQRSAPPPPPGPEDTFGEAWHNTGSGLEPGGSPSVPAVDAQATADAAAGVAAASASSPVISEAQLRRLHTIATNHKVPRDEAKRIILEVAGVASSKEISRDLYEAVCATLEAWEPPPSQFVAPEGARGSS